MIIIETTKEDLTLAEEEIKAISKSDVESYDNYFIADGDFRRLTYCKNAYQVIEKSIICSSFKFVHTNSDKKEAIPYIEQLKEQNAKVKLKDPEKIFSLIQFKRKKYLTERIYTNDKEFLQRHPKKRPAFHPGACNPKFAKVLVNLSGVEKGQTLIDPFCGTGGILIEASLMGIKCTGYDINEDMIHKTKVNLEYYNIIADVEKKDALTLDKKSDVIVTEIPFGKTTTLSQEVPQLISDFLKNAKKITSKIVIAVPHHYTYDFEGWTIMLKHDVYIHKSLSKRIFVLIKN